jgi:hypothetical protein
MENQQLRKPGFPLAMLLALASVLGVAVAIALAGVAMLLAAPAYADEGSLLLERGGAMAAATLLYAETESHDDGHTRVVEAYRNPYAERLTGFYLHRLPENAVLERLTFTPRLQEARHAVLTLRGGTALVQRTAQIAAGETLLVELEYRRRRAPRVLASR